jgi:hypothetical protein
MTLSEHFRLIAVHDSGAVTDRLNLGKCDPILMTTVSNQVDRSWRTLIASTSL